MTLNQFQSILLSIFIFGYEIPPWIQNGPLWMRFFACIFIFISLMAWVYFTALAMRDFREKGEL